MRQLDPASRGRTHESAGAQFMCFTDANGVSKGCDIKHFAQPRAGRAIAGDLLEATGEWYRAIRDLPPTYELPPGIAEAIEAAYRASLGWVEWLDRT